MLVFSSRISMVLGVDQALRVEGRLRLKEEC